MNIDQQPTVQPSGHASNPDALPGSGSGSGSADIASARNQRKQAIKYIQPVSASWAQDAHKPPGHVSDSKRATSETTKRRSGDSGTAHKSSSGEGQVQSVRHRSQSAAQKAKKRPARVDYAAAAAEAAAAATVAAAATAPVVAAPPAAGLHPAQAAMLLSQLQYQQYTAHLTAGAMQHCPPATVAAADPSRGGGSVRPSLGLGPGGSSTTQAAAMWPVGVVDAGGVQRRLDDICMQFMQVKDTYLRHAAALMNQSAVINQSSAPVKPVLPRKRKAQGDAEAASRAFDKAMQIINSSLQGMPMPLAPPPSPPRPPKRTAACS